MMKQKLYLITVLVVSVLVVLSASCAQPTAPPTPTEVVAEPTATVEPTREPTPTIEPTPTEEPTSALAQELKVPADDVTLHVRIAGNPEASNAMIAIHGGPGQSHHYMLDLERLAGSDFSVVTYDQRGVGDSTVPPADPSNYDLMDYVEDLEAVRRAVGADQVHLLGHSWGGIVAMNYAVVYPERVRSLVLVGSGSPTWEGIWEARAGFERRVKDLQQASILPQELPPGADYVAWFSDPAFPRSHPDKNAMRTEYSDKVNDLTLAAVGGFDLTTEVGQLDHRVLVLFGEDDPAGMPLVEETLAALRSADVDYFPLERCGHLWQECPDQFYPRVRAFLTAGKVYPGEAWQEAKTPEELGWSSEKLARAREYSERIGSAAVMIVDDGVVVDAWGDITRTYQCHSMRKSLMSALYGIYIAEGKIDISKTLGELGIDDQTPLTEAEKQATVADLLMARSGVYIPAAGEASSMKAMRPERGSHAPGTFWYYNNWDFNALGTIFDQETGEESIYQAFKTRIADPIGMQDYATEDLQYHYEPYSVHPYYGFRMSTRDLARFGLLFLREGQWRDQQIVPADWVRESTASHSECGPDSGYGYMWWTGVNGGLFPNVQVKEHSYYASGYRGHRVIVLPYRNLVIVHRVNTDGGDTNLDDAQIGLLLWLILDAAGETEIGEAPFIESAKGVRLTGDELRATLAGNTVRSEGGSGEIVASFAADGTLPLSLGGSLIDTGKWWVEDDKLCSQFTNPDLGAGGCSYVVQDGSTITLFDLDGALEITFETSRE